MHRVKLAFVLQQVFFVHVSMGSTWRETTLHVVTSMNVMILAHAANSVTIQEVHLHASVLMGTGWKVT